MDVRLQHYRDIEGDGFDAACAIEMGEHAGDREYPHFAALLHARLRPRGRLLVQQMSRGANAPSGGSPPTRRTPAASWTAACGRGPATPTASGTLSWGLYVMACAAWQSAAVSVVSPLLMSGLLIFGSGKRLLERHMAGRPGYAEYAARTSGFFPLPPRRAPSPR